MAEDSRDEVASQVPFYDLCCLLEKISDTSGTEKKKKILSTFLSSWREAHRKLHKDSPKTVRLDQSQVYNSFIIPRRNHSS